MVYFPHPPKKEQLPETSSYTHNEAFRDYMAKHHKDIDIRQFIKKGNRQSKNASSTASKKVRADVPSSRQGPVKYDIPAKYEKDVKRTMMAQRKAIRALQKKQNLNPDQGPVDVYIECLYRNEAL